MTRAPTPLAGGNTRFFDAGIRLATRTAAGVVVAARGGSGYLSLVPVAQQAQIEDAAWNYLNPRQAAGGHAMARQPWQLAIVAYPSAVPLVPRGTMDEGTFMDRLPEFLCQLAAKNKMADFL